MKLQPHEDLPTEVYPEPEHPKADDWEQARIRKRNRVAWAVKTGLLDWALDRMETWLK